MNDPNDGGPESPIRRHLLVGGSGAIAATAAAAGLVFRFGGVLAANVKVPPATASMSPEVKLVDDYNNWFIGGAYQGDMDKLKAGLPSYITDKTVLHEPISLPWGGTMIGYEGWVRLCRISDPIFAKVADRMEITAPTYYQSGNVVLHELGLTFKPKLAGEKLFSMLIIEKYTLENGRIKQIDEFWSDTATLLKKLAAMGAIAPT